MKILLVLAVYYFLSTCTNTAAALCRDDEDLQRHRCVCSSTSNRVQCSSLPNRCRTCYRYRQILFDENVTELPAGAFRYFEFFDTGKQLPFTIRFAHVNVLVPNSFSKINVDQDKTLEIKIAELSSSILPTNIFKDINLHAKAKLDVEIFNVTSTTLTIKPNAFEGIVFRRGSQFRFALIHAKDTIRFESSAGSVRLPPYAYMELYFSNFIEVHLSERCFDRVRQDQFSELITNFNHFRHATLLRNSFIDFHQLEESRFHLSLLNCQSLTVEQSLFSQITQFKSYIVISIFNLTSDLCFERATFNGIKQNSTATFQLEIERGQNVRFTTNSFANITQNLQSKLLVSATDLQDVYVAPFSFSDIHQEYHSLIEISMNSGRNLVFDDHAVNNVLIYRSSVLRIGFQHSRGALKMAENAFSSIYQDSTGDVVFQITGTSDFDFRFNQSTSLKHFEIINPLHSSQDFCRISNVPSHVLVKLTHVNQCSCTIFYLYRYVYRHLPRQSLLGIAPICYSNMSSDEIQLAENECAFKSKLQRCQLSEKKQRFEFDRGTCPTDTTRSGKGLTKVLLTGLLILGCLACCLASVYMLTSHKRKARFSNVISRYVQHYRRQRLQVFSADSYQELASMDEEDSNNAEKQVIVTYDTTTARTRICLNTERVDETPSNCDEEKEAK